ncbi:MAG: DUF429 domain-containing protein [Vicinamibacterales bacterium]
MRIFGVDFTSRPSFAKPIVCAWCEMDGQRLVVERLERLTSLEAFSQWLSRPGPWVGGVDFPFGQPRRLIQNLRWPESWSGYVANVRSLGRDGFKTVLEEYKRERPDGDREHLRLTDRLAGAQSPSKLYGVPVGVMFFEGAPRLLQSTASIVPVRPTASDQVVVEAYPALVARALDDRQKYKDAEAGGAGTESARVRAYMVESMRRRLLGRYGITVELAEDCRRACIEDASGDSIDAVFAAVQAAWAWTNRETGLGVPEDCDRGEGWIVDPITQPSRNSSITRVRPVFRQLLAADPTGAAWLPKVLRLLDPGPVAASMAADPGRLGPQWVQRRPYKDPVLGKIELEACFEYPVLPGRAFLRWLVEHPEHMEWPTHGVSPRAFGKTTQDWREKLTGRKGEADRAEAIRTAVRGIDGNASTSGKWWTFEGATEVDCCLQTDTLVLLIEGKRTERLSGGTEWYPGRNQLHRNLEAARDLAKGRAYGVVVVGEDRPAEADFGDPAVGLRHLAPAERANLMAHYLGFVTWRQLCRETGVDYDALPSRVARRVPRRDAQAE